MCALLFPISALNIDVCICMHIVQKYTKWIGNEFDADDQQFAYL